MLRILPPETLLYVQIRDYVAFDRGLDESPPRRLWNDPELQEFRAELQRSEGSLVELIRRTYGLDFELIQAASRGELVVAGFKTVDGSLSLTFFIQVADSAAAEQLLTDISARLVADDAQPGTSVVGDARLFRLSGSDEQLVLVTQDNYVMVSGDVGVAGQLLERWQTPSTADEAGLGDGLYATLAAAIPEPQPADVRWYVDPIPTLVASQRAAENADSLQTPAPDPPLEDSDPNRVPFPMRHGFPGLRAIAGKTWLTDREGQWHPRSLTRVHAPPPREGALKIFDFTPVDARPPAFVPAEAGVWSCVGWQLTSLINNIGDVWDDVTDSDGAFAGTMADYRDKLRVDLPGDVFPKLGPTIHSFSLYDRGAEFEGTVIAIDIREPHRQNERAVAAAIHRLMIDDPETVRLRVRGQTYPLWQMGLIVGDGTVPFSNAGVMVANGRLWLSSHAALIQRTLTEPEGGYANAAEYRRMTDELQQYSSSDDVARNITRLDLDIEYTYDVLRSEGIPGLETAENTYSNLLLRIIQQLDREIQIDFGTLPEFKKIRHYFGLTGIVARGVDDGWEIRTVSLSPP